MDNRDSHDNKRRVGVDNNNKGLGINDQTTKRNGGGKQMSEATYKTGITKEDQRTDECNDSFGSNTNISVNENDTKQTELGEYSSSKIDVNIKTDCTTKGDENLGKSQNLEYVCRKGTLGEPPNLGGEVRGEVIETLKKKVQDEHTSQATDLRDTVAHMNEKEEGIGSA
ncbi:hypothetical protein HAX54_000957 [Datura stramonium]|uniref:Uncharacterized protein n=1 Tax=Datura stramonium TaxID=4076 RepID=A0ABS8T1Q8_DATST|nr:hypothetical protein [Datura stramonium]